jgi:hypothetical protein
METEMKTLIDEEVVKQALDFIERHSNKWNGDGEHPMNTVTALRIALDAAEKVEPSKYSDIVSDGGFDPRDRAAPAKVGKGYDHV